MFDLSDFPEDSDGCGIEVQVQLQSGGFIKIYSADIDKLLSSGLYFPVFKVCIKGHLDQSKVAPGP